MNNIYLSIARIMLKKKTRTFPVLLVLLLLMACNTVQAQLSLTNGSPSALIDFSNTMPVTVGSNPSTAFAGAGFEPNPTTAGRLNSNAWSFTSSAPSCWSDGNLAFGGTQITTNTDYTRLATGVSVITGGVYAYTDAPASVANPYLMIQPVDGEFAPGYLTLRLQNNGTTIISQIAIAYDLLVNNNETRSNSFNFSWSTDNSSYTPVAVLNYTSIAAPDPLGIVTVPRATTITGISIPPGAYFYIRWSGADAGGGGSRDEFGLDNISISATYDPPCTQPTIQATAPTFTNVYSTQMDLNFTRGNGTGGVLVIASLSNTLSADPVSGYSYIANSDFGVGAAIGGGFVVYNGVANGAGLAATVTVTGLTPNTNYYYYLFEYGVSVPCYKIPGSTSSQATCLACGGTLPTDFFQSRSNGNWNNSNVWESSSTSNAGPWIPATQKPTSAARGIAILSPHTITLSGNETANLLNIALGAKLTYSNTGSGGYNLNIAADVSGVDLRVYGTYEIFGIQPTLAVGATAEIYSTGIVKANANAGTNTSDDFARSAQVYFLTGSVFEWNNASAFETNNMTYFPNAGLTDIATFRVSLNLGTLGAINPTNFLGLFEANGTMTFANSGVKTFRNGLIGTAAITQDVSCGKFSISGPPILPNTAVIGGNGAINLNAGGLEINVNTVTTMISNKTINAAGAVGTFSVNGGSLYCDSYVISGTAIFTLATGSTMRLGSPDGISTSGPTGNIQVLGNRTFNANTRFIYNGTTNQVTGSGLPTTLSALIIANTVGTVTLTNTNTSSDTLKLTSGLFAAGINQVFGIFNNGAVIATSGNFASGATAGILNFQGAGTFSGSCSPYNVYASGGVNFSVSSPSDIVRIQSGGRFRINTGGFASSNGPFYADGSMLEYNTGFGFNVGPEWQPNADLSTKRGGPFHVSILASGTAVNFLATSPSRTIRGDLNISSGTGLALSTISGGDLNIAGNWTRAATGTFTSNARMVTFNGTGANQTVTVTGGGTETFAFLTITKPDTFPTFIMAAAPNATNITVNGNPASGAPVTTLLLSGNIELNQNTFNFTSWNGNQNHFRIDNVAGPNTVRNISSAGGQGVFAIYNSVANNSTVEIFRISTGPLNRRSTLVFGSTVKVTIGAVAGGTGGIDFGSRGWNPPSAPVASTPITTINGTLQIDTRGFVTVNAPTYGASSTLIYNTTGTYNRGIEWGSTQVQPGYPNHVIVQNNSTLNLNHTPPNANRYLSGNLTISAGSGLILNSSGTYTSNILTVGGNLVLDGTLTLPATIAAFGEDLHIVGNWTRSATGVFNPNDRAVYFDGAVNSTITANGGQTFPYLRLTKSLSTNSLSLNSNINITKEISLTTGTISLLNNNVNMKSDASYTASVTAINPATASINYSGTGRFVVERFIPTGTGGLNHGRTWQFLAVPTKGSTINQSWQEGNTPLANTLPGYGTTISSEKAGAIGRGYDFVTPQGPSMKTYDYSIGALGGWVSVDDGVTNTNTKLIDNVKGYMIFVRGDRSVQSITTATPVTLRTIGKLYSPGADAPPTITVQADKYESIGNPYASAIDFTMISRSGGVENKFYVWDPTLGGTFGYGGYQTISAAAGWIPSSHGTTNYPTLTANSRIQSGQAFLVHATGTSGTVVFAETNKVSNSAVVFRPAGANLSVMRTALYAGSGNTAVIADGNTVAFDRNYRNDYDGNDALKMMNPGENFGISRFSKILSVEARKPVVSTDTIFFDLTNLRKQKYEFRFAPEGINTPGLKAYLVDKFDNSKTSVNLNSETNVEFAVTDDPASSSPGRFMLVFKQQRKQFISGTLLSAVKNENGISLNWKSDDAGLSGTYAVERSADGNHFLNVHSMPAGNETNYSWTDTDPMPGINYYRIRYMGTGSNSYSNKVIVPVGDENSKVSIYPNPVKNKLLGLYFNEHMKAGNYSLKLYNHAGQLAWSGNTSIKALAGKNLVQLPETLAKGTYQFEMLDKYGERRVLQVFID